MTWSYEEALSWLYARQSLGIKLGLGKVEALLARLDDPHLAYRTVHVAGTNGKGSVVRMMAAVLKGSGHRVGCTTSPHLVSFRERIEVDGRPVSPAVVADGLARIRPIVERLDATGESCTFFEVVTALAFLSFREAGVAWAVVETGMGGRLDATNVVAPELAIVTNVELDHAAHLGATRAAIAYEKSGIMKRGVPCVTAATGDALTVLAARSHELGVPMSLVASATAVAGPRRVDYTVLDRPGHELQLLRPTGEAVYEVGLAGAHQHENAALVVAAADALRLRGVPIPERALVAALRDTRHPGRLDSFLIPADALAPGASQGAVEVLVDGAHNPAAGEAVRRHLFETGWRGFYLVAGFCADKEWQATVEGWLFPAARLWAVPVRNPRSLDPAALRDLGRAAGVRSETAADVPQALRRAAEAGATRILVAGSLFLAGEAVAYLSGDSVEEIHGTQ